MTEYDVDGIIFVPPLQVGWKRVDQPVCKRLGQFCLEEHGCLLEHQPESVCAAFVHYNSVRHRSPKMIICVVRFDIVRDLEQPAQSNPAGSKVLKCVKDVKHERICLTNGWESHLAKTLVANARLPILCKREWRVGSRLEEAGVNLEPRFGTDGKEVVLRGGRSRGTALEKTKLSEIFRSGLLVSDLQQDFCCSVDVGWRDEQVNIDVVPELN